MFLPSSPKSQEIPAASETRGAGHLPRTVHSPPDPGPQPGPRSQGTHTLRGGAPRAHAWLLSFAPWTVADNRTME